MLLFSSGKFVCTGAVNEKMFYDAVEKLIAKLIQKGLLIKVIGEKTIKIICNSSI
ncbi:MAG: hypothetical protein QW542_01340 [Thermoproteota archaeon]